MIPELLHLFMMPGKKLALGIVVWIFGVARITRLICQDSFPPAVWFRDQWRRITHDGAWSDLIDCPFCVSPYVAVVSMAWAILGGLDPVWWIVHGLAALSYLAAIVVAQDT